MRKRNQRISKFENEKMGDMWAQVIGNRGNMKEKEKK